MDSEEQFRFPIVDRNYLENRKDIEGSFLRNLIKVFNREVPKIIKKLKKSNQDCDYEDVKNLGHKLKGMSLNMGAMYLSEIGRTIEEADPETLHLTIDQLNSVFKKTRLALAELQED